MQLKLRYVPNFISGLRLLIAPVLFLLNPLTAGFFAVYILCGITDIADGWLARRYHWESLLGSRLDSLADLVFVSVLVFRLVPLVHPRMQIAVWAAIIATVRFCAALVAKCRFGTCGFLHTGANKLTGAILFCYPLVMKTSYSQGVLYIICGLATLSAAEEFLIEATAERWEPNRSGFFRKKAGNAL